MALRKLAIITVICFLFMVAEVIGGYLSNSVAIMTDAAHMFSDVSGFLFVIVCRAAYPNESRSKILTTP